MALSREEFNARRRKNLPPGWRLLKKNGPAARPVLERFFEKINKNGPVIYPHLTPCWEWLGSIDIGGYGYFGIGSRKTEQRTVKAHKFMWQLYNIAIPEGLFVLHRCDNRKCVNPDHLWLGTHQDNMDDMVAKGRQVHGERRVAIAKSIPPEKRARGEDLPNHKLTWDQVEEIRKKYMAGATRAALGRGYGVSATSIFHIVHNNKWKSEFRKQQ